MKTIAKKTILKIQGGEIISKGLYGIQRKLYRNVEALSLLTASPRLNEIGFNIEVDLFAYPHLLLYKKLQKKFDNNAHLQYNAIMQRVLKFCNQFK